RLQSEARQPAAALSLYTHLRDRVVTAERPANRRGDDIFERDHNFSPVRVQMMNHRSDRRRYAAELRALAATGITVSSSGDRGSLAAILGRSAREPLTHY